jgi:antitoxin MazE
MNDLIGRSAGWRDMQARTAGRKRSMRAETWGDGLVLRLPADIVEALGLKEGDEVELRIAGARAVEIARSITPEQREAALARLKEARWKLPPDWKFDRDAANSR